MRIIQTFVLTLTIALAASAQAIGARVCDATIEYQAPTLKKVFEVSQIKGSVDDRDKAPLANTCIGLFSEDGKKLVAVQGTDAKGKFQFPNIESGSFHVVVRDASKNYRVLSFSLVVSQSANTRRKNRIHIHMSATRGIPSMSVNDHE